MPDPSGLNFGVPGPNDWTLYKALRGPWGQFWGETVPQFAGWGTRFLQDAYLRSLGVDPDALRAASAAVPMLSYYGGGPHGQGMSGGVSGDGGSIPPLANPNPIIGYGPLANAPWDAYSHPVMREQAERMRTTGGGGQSGNTARTGGGTGGGGGGGGAGGGGGTPAHLQFTPMPVLKPPAPPKPKTQLDLALEDLDSVLGPGWSAGFTAQNGIDPIRFYAKAFPDEPVHIQVEKAKRAAVNDARWHPDELADWQMKHGNVPPPPDQWKTWWYINQSGGPNFNAGRGVDPYGVH